MAMRIFPWVLEMWVRFMRLFATRVSPALVSRAPPSRTDVAAVPLPGAGVMGKPHWSMAIGSLGRTQDVCADDYLDFMQRLTSDLAILSAPYPLEEPPIASTLKVGISRPQGGQFVYIPVSRSRTSGFFYDASRNSIGFKSDPIDGECGGGDCSLIMPLSRQKSTLLVLPNMSHNLVIGSSCLIARGNLCLAWMNAVMTKPVYEWFARKMRLRGLFRARRFDLFLGVWMRGRCVCA